MEIAVAKVDCPDLVLATPVGKANQLRYGWDLNPGRQHLARDADGNLVGLLGLHYPKYENTDQLWMDVWVHPDHRDGDVWEQLIAFAEQEAQTVGRTMLGLNTFDTERDIALATGHGFVQKAVEVNRKQDIAGLDWEVVQKLYDGAVEKSAEYELVRVLGALPEEMLEDMIAVTESINDAPTDDLEIEDDVYSTERLRAYEEAQAKSGTRIYRLIARNKETGALAGHTIIGVEGDRPEMAWQHDTAVSRDHRGHRLGALLKAGMLLWLREAEPQIARIDTWNAESNNHMIGINEQLNYTIVGRFLDYQKKL
ncbi:GNAT family N-acetyltransferase [Kribbella sandramycini]|uniref:GNAT family N-acetyltransferase n=1 Tax=Kribbella sandramycini TaxID=60450 RepID=A0A7Y4NXC8_9ACTN|nr:GNAT family N-acetyltransferase [Kribbella sandramycini]